MARFDRQFLSKVLERTSIVEVVGKKVAWDKRKSNPQRGDFWACCPFHGEKSPSFHAVEAKGQYHCFGCGEHGNAFDFLVATQNISFFEAVEQLAKSAGIEVPKDTYETREKTSQTQRVLLVLSDARKLFEECLNSDEGKLARDYLTKRGIAKKHWQEFGLGFVPLQKNWLRDRLIARNHTIDDILESGLLRKNEDRAEPYELYRNRLMFAIEDMGGKTVSFGGRTLEKDGMPKYLNGPETIVFSKSHTLYRYKSARANAKNAHFIIAEGYLDVISLEINGFAAVAPLGTALTEDQLTLAWRAANRPVLCFDGDSAGMKAATRALDRAISMVNATKSLSFAIMPEGQDPDDILRNQGRNQMAEILDKSQSLARFMFNSERAVTELINAEDIAALRVRLRAKINEIKDEDLKSEIKVSIKSMLDEALGRNISQEQNKPNDFRNNRRQTINTPSIELVNIVKKSKTKSKPARALIDIIAGPIRVRELLENNEEVYSGLNIDNKGFFELRNVILERFNSGAAIDFSALYYHLEKRKLNNAFEALEIVKSLPLSPYLVKDGNLKEAVQKWLSAIEKFETQNALKQDASLLRNQANSGEEAALKKLMSLVTERQSLNKED